MAAEDEQALRFRECKWAGCSSSDFDIIGSEPEMYAAKVVLGTVVPARPSGNTLYRVVCENGHESVMDGRVDTVE